MKLDQVSAFVIAFAVGVFLVIAFTGILHAIGVTLIAVCALLVLIWLVTARQRGRAPR